MPPKKKPVEPPAPKDDGKRYVVESVATGRSVYPGDGLPRAEAERLSAGLRAETRLREVS